MPQLLKEVKLTLQFSSQLQKVDALKAQNFRVMHALRHVQSAASHDRNHIWEHSLVSQTYVLFDPVYIPSYLLFHEHSHSFPFVQNSPWGTVVFHTSIWILLWLSIFIYKQN